MEWTFRSDRPIYVQLAEQITAAVASGVWTPGERLPTVRELAAQAGLNPNTVQRAMLELEQRGLIYTQRTNGRFVTQHSAAVEAARKQLAQECVRSFLEEMARLGYSAEAVQQMMQSEKEAV